MGEQVVARIWGRSSVGRAPALQAGGREFESLRLHFRAKSVREAGLRTLEVNKEDEARKCSSQGLVAQPVRAHA